MSEPKRYALRLPDISYGTEEAHNGEYVRYDDYSRLKAEVEELTGLLKASTYYNTSDEVTRLKAEVERLTKENEMLTHKVRYWQIEAECDHGRWLRCLEDLEHLRRLK